MIQLKAKKSLGQNFLRDKNIICKIIDLSGIGKDDCVLEIGPGTGALTEYLIEKCKFLLAVEYDERAVDLLQNRFPAKEYGHFKLIHSDILDVRLEDYINDSRCSLERIKVIGNIPYNISSDIIFYLIENRGVIESAQLMLQKEVAKRLCGRPGTKTYGITTVAVNLTARCEYMFEISSKSFVPSPKVTSAIVKIVFDKDIAAEQYNQIMEIVKSAFNQRRKQLHNSLKNLLDRKTRNRTQEFITFIENKKSNFFVNRPEQLSVDDFIFLNSELEAFNK